MDAFRLPESFYSSAVANDTKQDPREPQPAAAAITACLLCQQRGTATSCVGGDAASKRACEPCQLLTGGAGCVILSSKRGGSYAGESAAGGGGPMRVVRAGASKRTGTGAALTLGVAFAVSLASAVHRAKQSVSATSSSSPFSAGPSSGWSVPGLAEQLAALQRADVTSLHPRQRQPPPPPEAATNEDDAIKDDPRLTPIGRSTLLQTAVKAIPPDANTPHHRPSFDYVQQNFTSDAPAARFYRYPALETTTLWVGSLLLLRGLVPGIKATDTWLSHDGEDLATVSAKLLRRLERLIHKGIERVKTEAARLGPDLALKLGYAPFHTPENLALLAAIFAAAVFGFYSIGQGETTRKWYKELFDLFRVTRIPGESCCVAPKDYSGWMLREIWLRLFWSSCGSETILAAGSRTLPAIRPEYEFPTVPFPILDKLFTSLPPWRADLPSPPSVAYLLAQAPQLTASQFLLWLDPAAMINPIARHTVLNMVLSDISESRALMVQQLMTSAFVRIEEYRKWLRDVAGLRKLDVLFADAAFRAEEDVDAYVQGSGVTPSYSIKLFTNPYLNEALRRLWFLQEAFEVMELHLPREIIIALHDEDLEALLTSIPGLESMDSVPGARSTPGSSGSNGSSHTARVGVLERIKTVSILTFFKLGEMMLHSPEPFADVSATEEPQAELPLPEAASAEAEPNAATRISQLDMEMNDEQIAGVWFASPAFLRANQCAILIARLLQDLTPRLTTDQLSGQAMVILLYYSAIYSAWLQLLTLRKISKRTTTATASPPTSNVSSTSTESNASAESQLRNDLVAHIECCLDFLDMAGKPQAREAGALIRTLLAECNTPSGKMTGLDADQLELVVMAKQLSIEDRRTE